MAAPVHLAYVKQASVNPVTASVERLASTAPLTLKLVVPPAELAAFVIPPQTKLV